MKALSLWQPWASLWLSERKMHETRSWPVPRSAPRFLLVQASKTRKGTLDAERDPELRSIVEDEFGGHWGLDLPFGQLIGVVELIDCKATQEVYPPNQVHTGDDYFCGNFEPGRWAWQRGRYHAFSQPRGWMGRQGLFDVPWDDVKLLCPAWVTP